MPLNAKIMIVAGEASADGHAAALINELKRLDPSTTVYGAGGPFMARAGVRLISDFASTGTVGTTENLPKLKKFGSTFRGLLKSIQSEKPDLVLLLDLPEFNMILARRIKKRTPQTPIIYYISPQVWAWRKGRIQTIKKLMSRVLVLFRFEEEMYRQAGVDVEFVGHPLLDKVKPSLPRAALREKFRVEDDAHLIGFLPGSRKEEVRRYLPVMIEAGQILIRQDPRLRFAMPVAPTLDIKFVESFFRNSGLDAIIVDNAAYDVLAACDAAVLGSGTVTLEAAILETPMIIVAAVSKFNYLLGRLLIKIPWVGLPNIIAGREIITELIQEEFTPRTVAGQLYSLLHNRERTRIMKQELAQVRDSLGPGRASGRAAEAVYSFLKNQAK